MHAIPKTILHTCTKAALRNTTATGGIGVCALLLLVLLSGCLGDTTSPGSHTTSFVSSDPNTANQQITYSTGAQDVLIRAFYGGGLHGSLSLAPQVSIYGDGSYILDTTRQGELSSDALQALLHTLIDRDGLLNLPQQQFTDIADQNATFLLLNLNGKHLQLMYGSFGNQQESAQAMAAYHRLGQGLTAINNALTGPTKPYHGQQVALLVRQDFSPNLTQPPATWPLADFTLAQAAVFECGLIPPDIVDQNQETGCLKYTIPQNAILLTATQLAAIQQQLNTQQQGEFREGRAYYTVTLRQLLPDELPTGQLAMFGSAQGSYMGVPLLQGSVPPIPTPTPSQ